MALGSFASSFAAVSTTSTCSTPNRSKALDSHLPLLCVPLKPGSSRQCEHHVLLPVPQTDSTVLREKINAKPLIYLDNAETSQKPQNVIYTLREFYETYNSNVHRGVHTLSDHANKFYEGTRRKITQFINATPQGVIYTRNATEGINVVAYT